MKRIFAVFVAVMAAWSVMGQVVIRNDVFWDAKGSKPLYSQGGGIFRFRDPSTGETAYFWYGAHYREAEQYREDPTVTLTKDNILGVTCYRSTDLKEWEYMGHVLTAEDIRGNARHTGWFGRLGVAYIEETGQYAMFAQHGNSVMVSLADNPLGPFRVHKHIDMMPMIGTHNTGDQTVFTDEDTGRDYLVYSYGQGRHRGYISEIGVMEDGTIGLKNCVEVFRGESREGNCMFKYRGRYYLCASNIYGWDGSNAYYLVSDSIFGPYLPTNNMQVMPGCERDYAHVSQTGFFFNVKGTQQETVVFCGDRWCEFAGNGLGYNQWMPMSFDGDGTPFLNSLSEWTLDEKTGLWAVGRGNNYVMNGSFEADRKLLPSEVKPRQEQLLGWQTEVIKGNPLEVGNPGTIHPNYMNTQEDRREVVGEKALMISDAVSFERRVSQEVGSTPYVNLEDGEYELRLMFRDNARFRKLSVTVESDGSRQVTDLRKLSSGNKWTKAVMRMKVSGGRATIVFHAVGKPGAQCMVDDVELVRAD